MGSEDFALTHWHNWTTGGDPPPAPPPTFKPWTEWHGGSRNHDPMTYSTYALGAALRGVTHEGARAAVQGCLNLLAWQREKGHMDQEAAVAYEGFHAGYGAAMALAGKAWYGLTGEPELWIGAVGWMADHVALMRAMRASDGQVLGVGARIGPDPGHGAGGSTVVIQLLDPLPSSALVSWLRPFITPDGQPGEKRTGDPQGLGWDFRRHSWMRVVLRARNEGALPAEAIRRLADGRRPRLMRPLYRWSAGGLEHAAMPEVKGLGPRQWWCRWVPGSLNGQSWLRMEYPSGERKAPHGEPAPWLLEGRGPHKSPTPIPIPGGLAPAFAPGTPIPPLPTLADLGEDAGSPPPPPPKDEEEELMEPAFKIAPDSITAADWGAVTNGPDRRAALTALRVLAERDPRAETAWRRIETAIVAARVRKAR